jgi:hypothetical protein
MPAFIVTLIAFVVGVGAPEAIYSFCHGDLLCGGQFVECDFE